MYSAAPLSVRDFVKLDDIAHLLRAPDMYIDSLRHKSEQMYVMYRDLTVDDREITMPVGLRNLFREILSNACDNVDRSIRAGVDPGIIEIDMSDTTVSVRNGGVPIPVEVHPEYPGTWLPEMLFSCVRAGSNFGKDRYGGGRNGMGAVIVNAFSNYFRVIIENSVRRRYYEQTWINLGANRETISCGEPIVCDYDGRRSSVTVAYQAELWRFGYAKGVYPEEAEYIFMKDAVDASLTCKVPVVFNGLSLDYTSIVAYSNLYTKAKSNYITYYQWPKGTSVVYNEDGTQNGLVLPIIEAIIIDSPGFSFGLCNSVFNLYGGIHVDSIRGAFCKSLLPIVNDTKKDSKYKTTRGDIEKNISVIISVRVHNPEWGGGQTKTELKSFVDTDGNIGEFSISFSSKSLEAVRGWDLIGRLEAIVKARRNAVLSKTDGKKTNKITVVKGKKCAWLGTKRSRDVTLIVFEGDSAMEYSKEIRSCHPNGYNEIALLPVGGKIKNVTDCEDDVEKLSSNKFFVEFKKMVGLREGMCYTEEKAFGTLNVGRIMIMTDADIDGKHIKGLFINFLNRFYPSLLERKGFLVEFLTKCATATLGREKVKFFSTHELEAWKLKTSNWESWTIDYYKGLGTAKKKEARDDYTNSRVIDIVKDEHAEWWLNTMFARDKKWSEIRRNLVREYILSDSRPSSVPIATQCISRFVGEDLVEYCYEDLKRHMPKYDGLTPTGRKIIHRATVVWKWWTKGKLSKERLVSFAYGVMGKTDYHHGDLSNVVIRMSQDFVGSNNVSYFVPDGMYGTRDEGGKDHASARYPNIYPNNWWMSRVIKKRDEDLLTYIHGQKARSYIEPEIYYPVIPLILVNGVDALMKGYKSFIPSHNPLDVVNWLVQRIRGERPREILPWYRGFEGTIEVVDERSIRESVVIVDDLDENDEIVSVERSVAELRGKFSMVSRGVVEIIDGTSGWVTELPVGMWTSSYTKILERMKSSGKIVDYDDQSTTEAVRIRVHGFKLDRSVTEEDFRITKSNPLNNMRILNDGRNGLPERFETVTDILEGFYRWRLPAYQRRKNNDVERLRESISIIQDKLDYVRAINEGSLVRERGKREVLADIDRLGLNREVYLRKMLSDRSYNRESVTKMVDEMKSTRKRLDECIRVSPEEIWIEDLRDIYDAYVEKYN